MVRHTRKLNKYLLTYLLILGCSQTLFGSLFLSDRLNKIADSFGYFPIFYLWTIRPKLMMSMSIRKVIIISLLFKHRSHNKSVWLFKGYCLKIWSLKSGILLLHAPVFSLNFWNEYSVSTITWGTCSRV